MLYIYVYIYIYIYIFLLSIRADYSSNPQTIFLVQFLIVLCVKGKH